MYNNKVCYLLFRPLGIVSRTMEQHVSMVMSDEMRIQGHQSTLEVKSAFRKSLSHCATRLTYVLLTAVTTGE